MNIAREMSLIFLYFCREGATDICKFTRLGK